VSLSGAVRNDLHPLRAAYFLDQRDGLFERYLGFSGGRGDGSLEALFLVVLGMLVLMTVSRYTNK